MINRSMFICIPTTERDSNGRAAKKVLQLVNPNLTVYLAATSLTCLLSGVTTTLVSHRLTVVRKTLTVLMVRHLTCAVPHQSIKKMSRTYSQLFLFTHCGETFHHIIIISFLLITHSNFWIHHFILVTTII